MGSTVTSTPDTLGSQISADVAKKIEGEDYLVKALQTQEVEIRLDTLEPETVQLSVTEVMGYLEDTSSVLTKSQKVDLLFEFNYQRGRGINLMSDTSLDFLITQSDEMKALWPKLTEGEKQVIRSQLNGADTLPNATYKYDPATKQMTVDKLGHEKIYTLSMPEWVGIAPIGGGRAVIIYDKRDLNIEQSKPTDILLMYDNIVQEYFDANNPRSMDPVSYSARTTDDLTSANLTTSGYQSPQALIDGFVENTHLKEINYTPSYFDLGNGKTYVGCGPTSDGYYYMNSSDSKYQYRLWFNPKTQDIKLNNFGGWGSADIALQVVPDSFNAGQFRVHYQSSTGGDLYFDVTFTDGSKDPNRAFDIKEETPK
ncbi:hypothetical protein K1X76_00625 [bacterium]|nr:hypothetical protein [bacterium]